MKMERQDLFDALDAFVLDQLDAETTIAFENALDDHPDLAHAAADLREALAGLAHDDRSHAPPGLRESVLTSATRRRRPGSDSSLAAAAGAARCHRVTAELLSSVIGDLDEVDMRSPTIYRTTVVDLIRHVIGVERQLVQCFGAPGEHALNSLTADGHRAVRDGTDDGSSSTVVDTWHRHSTELIESVARTTLFADGTVFEVAGMMMPAEQLLVVRAFELWIHTEDICRAIGRLPVIPPADVVHTMAAVAIELLLPLVARLTQRSDTTVRVTLTGSGGGSWLRRLAVDESVVKHQLDPFTPADATVVADVVDFCRLVADRADADHIINRYGDTDVCDEILRLAPTLADYGAGPLP